MRRLKGPTAAATRCGKVAGSIPGSLSGSLPGFTPGSLAPPTAQRRAFSVQADWQLQMICRCECGRWLLLVVSELICDVTRPRVNEKGL